MKYILLTISLIFCFQNSVFAQQATIQLETFCETDFLKEKRQFLGVVSSDRMSLTAGADHGSETKLYTSISGYYSKQKELVEISGRTIDGLGKTVGLWKFTSNTEKELLAPLWKKADKRDLRGIFGTYTENGVVKNCNIAGVRFFQKADQIFEWNELVEDYQSLVEDTKNLDKKVTYLEKELSNWREKAAQYRRKAGAAIAQQREIEEMTAKIELELERTLKENEGLKNWVSTGRAQELELELKRTLEENRKLKNRVASLRNANAGLKSTKEKLQDQIKKFKTQQTKTNNNTKSSKQTERSMKAFTLALCDQSAGPLGVATVTQETISQKFGVSANAVSHWRTFSNGSDNCNHMFNTPKGIVTCSQSVVKNESDFKWFFGGPTKPLKVQDPGGSPFIAVGVTSCDFWRKNF